MSASDHLQPLQHGWIPPKGTVIYRGEHGNGGGPTTGIHWTLDPAIANDFPRLGKNGELLSVELTDPENQVIPHGALTSMYYDEGSGTAKTNRWSRMQGFPHEKEVRLRPGATFRVNGRDVTIDGTKGQITYQNLHEYAITPEAADKEWWHAVNTLGHVQGSLFGESEDQYVKPVKDKKTISKTKEKEQHPSQFEQLSLDI